MQHFILCASHSLYDPLFRGLMYEYLRALQAKHPGAYCIHLFTEEQAAYRLTGEKAQAAEAELAALNIRWYPMPYRSGRWMLAKKVWNFGQLFLRLLYLRLRYPIRFILGFLVIAGGYAYLASRVLGLRLGVFCFEPHSEYMADFGIWSRASWKYKILNRVERWQAIGADYVTAPTDHTVELLAAWGSRAKVRRLPISVDTDKFVFKAEARARLRRDWDLEGRYVLLYLGKFGGIYYSAADLAAWFAPLAAALPELCLWGISPGQSAELKAALEAAGLSPEQYRLSDGVPYSEVEDYISAADLGMVAIPPLPSQKYRTPVKIGNYLACGLPFIINRGIADDDRLAERENLGLVLPDLDPQHSAQTLAALAALRAEPLETLRARCRAAALQHRSMAASVEALEAMLGLV